MLSTLLLARMQGEKNDTKKNNFFHVVFRLYECPIYRKPARTDLNYIGSIDFESDTGPRHWTMRGVALLCDIK